MNRTIHKIDVFVQCIGAPESWFSHANPTGFPGIRLPDDDLLALCRSSFQGHTFTVPNVSANPSSEELGAYAQACAETIGSLFEQATGDAAIGFGRWALVPYADPTIAPPHGQWVPGLGAVAMMLGTQRVGPDGTVDPNAPIEIFSDPYAVPTSSEGVTQIQGRFVFLFHLS